MNCAALQSRGETVDAEVFSPKHDVANGGVVWQHADDDFAIEEVGNSVVGLDRAQQALPSDRATYICDHPMSGGGEVCRHDCPHVAETDEFDGARVCGANGGSVRDPAPMDLERSSLAALAISIPPQREIIGN